MLAYLGNVLGCVRPCPVSLIVIRERCLGDVIVDNIGMISIRHRIDKRCLEIQTEVRTQGQSFYRLQFYESITEDAPVVEVVVAVLILLTTRVLTVGHTTHRTCEGLAIFFVNRNDGRHLQGILHRMAIYLRGISQSQILTYGYDLV